MNRDSAIRSAAIMAALLALTLFSPRAQAGQITGIISSDVQAFFGSQDDFYQQTETPNNTGNSWTPVSSTPAPTLTPAPPYPSSGLPNIPALYAGYPNATFPIGQNIGFAAPLGHAPSSPFSYGASGADYHIYGGYGGSGNFTPNAGVVLGNNTGNLMYVNDPAASYGYVYEEVEFAIDYNVAVGGISGASVGPRPYLVQGTFGSGGPDFAQFGAQLNYYFMTVNSITGVVGSANYLGSLDYNFYLSGGGSFLQVVPNTTPSLAGFSTPGPGILEITGDMFLIGDPVDFSVEAVPEPSSAALLGIGLVAIGIMFTVRRRSTLSAGWLPRLTNHQSA